MKVVNRRNVLMLGSTSFTGSHIIHHLGNDHNFRNVSRSQVSSNIHFDVYSDLASDLTPHLEWADIVINCFSNGDVDSCEKNPEPSKVINLDFPVALCNFQKQIGFHLIHFSSNAVYDGDSPLYSEESPHEPVNIYGKLKSSADEYLRHHSSQSTILRPITMFGQLLGKQRHNPFTYFLQQINENRDISAVNDVYVNMLHVDVLIECVRTVMGKGIYGEFNISGDQIVNRFQFVSEIKNNVPSSDSTIVETNSSDFVTVAKRPADSSFDNTQMKKVLGVHPIDLSLTIKALVAQSARTVGDQNEAGDIAA